MNNKDQLCHFLYVFADLIQVKGMKKTKVEESPNLLWKEVIESVILDGIKCGEE